MPAGILRIFREPAEMIQVGGNLVEHWRAAASSPPVVTGGLTPRRSPDVSVN